MQFPKGSIVRGDGNDGNRDDGRYLDGCERTLAGIQHEPGELSGLDRYLGASRHTGEYFPAGDAQRDESEDTQYAVQASGGERGVYDHGSEDVREFCVTLRYKEKPAAERCRFRRGAGRFPDALYF